MTFASFEFLLGFLPVALLLWWTLVRLGNATVAYSAIVTISVAFYAAWSIQFLPLIAGLIGATFLLGKRLAQAPSRWLLALGVLLNVGTLGYFKYANFALENVSAVIGHEAPVLDIVLPLGLSFIAFQMIGFLVDAHRGKVEQLSFLRFATFITFFPQLVAGPIVHHADFNPQTRQLPIFDWEQLGSGLALFVLALGKKLLIADPIGRAIDPLWASADTLTMAEAWFALLGYSIQLYVDFSAYSEMALGLGLMFGFRLPINFNSPYQAACIADFWRRWHITLSDFLRDYVYFAMGGSRRGFAIGIAAAFATMLLGGLWHGAGWTFVLWGALHGLYIGISRLWGRAGGAMSPRFAHAITLTAVVLAWLPFRASTLGDAGAIGLSLLGLSDNAFGPLSSKALLWTPLVVLAWYLALTRPPLWQSVRELPLHAPRIRLGLAGVASLAVLVSGSTASFLYWTF